MKTPSKGDFAITAKARSPTNPTRNTLLDDPGIVVWEFQNVGHPFKREQNFSRFAGVVGSGDEVRHLRFFGDNRRRSS